MSIETRHIAAAALAMLLAYGALFLLGESAVDFYTREDGIVETIGAAALLVAAIFFALTFVRLQRRGEGGVILRAAFLVLAAAFVFGAGEEISWGQRILGIDTPEGLREANAQDELNIHNLNFLDGLLEVDRLFRLFWFSFGVLLPIGAALFERVREVASRYLPILPIWAAFLFITNQVIAELTSVAEAADPGLYAGNVLFDQARYEVTESVVAIIFALGAARLFAEASQSRPESDAHSQVVGATDPGGRAT